MSIICLCRRGFEKEVASEIADLAAQYSVQGFVRAKENTGYVEYVCQDFTQSLELVTEAPFSQCVFIRHWFVITKILNGLPQQDRATPLLASLEPLPAMKSLEYVTLDTNDGKALGRLAKGVSTHLRAALKQQKRMNAKSLWCGHVLFLTGASACIGVFLARNCSAFEGGVPRLRLPKDAPSRATLKLEEAWHQFVPKDEWDKRIAPSMTAVDLGAAPGGWTWQLIRKSMFVDAIDNGPMEKTIMESGQVKHYTEDAFKFSPTKPVNWLVSDIADRPSKVANLIVKWAVNRWFREAIFNLKLPMKKRYDEVLFCRSIIEDALREENIEYELNFKQLYHDREEVTGHLRLRGAY